VSAPKLSTAREPAALVFVVPMPPNLANGRMHYMQKHRIKVGYWALLDMMHLGACDAPAINAFYRLGRRAASRSLGAEIERACLFASAYVGAKVARRDPNLVAQRWPRAAIRSVMYVGAKNDAGNAMNRHKWVEDWLVTRGFLVDDNPDALRWDGLPEQVVKRDGNYRIELTLTAEPTP